MICSSWDIERGRLKLVILSHFLLFYLPKNQTNQNFEEILKTCWIYHHFTQVYQKPQSYHKWFRRNGVRQTEFFAILGHFLPFSPTNDPENQNCAHVHHKWQSHYVWFLRYGFNEQSILSFWTVFCLFTRAPKNPENLNFEKMRKTP